MEKIDNKYIWPIEPKYKIAEHDKYGIRKNHYVLFKKRAHSGFDITADIGTQVKSICNGKVILAEFDGTTTEGLDAFNDGYGNKVEILNEDGKRIIYAHLREILVQKGEIVKQGKVIGKSGSSGGSRVPHLHLEIRKTNTDETGLDNTISPLLVLPKKDLETLNKQYQQEPYAHLWRILVSENPWDFSKEDIPYSESREYIK